MSPQNEKKTAVTLVGCGNMGGALAQSWVLRPDIVSVCVSDPNEIQVNLSDSEKVFHVKRLPEADFDSSAIIVLAVKPQIMESVCRELESLKPKKVPVLSIAAGVTIENFQAWLGAECPIIRSMPNTPAAIGQGISALCANDKVSEPVKALAEGLLSAAGETLWVDDEGLMDAVTAISGSGPAYVFYFIEALAQAAEGLGFPHDAAKKLARQTVIGAGGLAAVQGEVDASTLRENVTSPGGTTAAALSVLMDGRLQDLLNEAVKAAQKRGQELAG